MVRQSQAPWTIPHPSPGPSPRRPSQHTPDLFFQPYPQRLPHTAPSSHCPHSCPVAWAISWILLPRERRPTGPRPRPMQGAPIRPRKGLPSRAAVGSRALTGGADGTPSTAAPRDKLAEGWAGRATLRTWSLSPLCCGSSDSASLALLTHSRQGHLSLPPSLLPSCLPTAALTPAGMLKPCLGRDRHRRDTGRPARPGDTQGKAANRNGLHGWGAAEGVCRQSWEGRAELGRS